MPDQEKELTATEILTAIFTGIEVPYQHTDPIDLRTIPREKWEDYLCFPLLLPPDAQRYVDGMIDGACTTLEKDHLEDRVNAFHGIEHPWTAVFLAGEAVLMRE